VYNMNIHISYVVILFICILFVFIYFFNHFLQKVDNKLNNIQVDMKIPETFQNPKTYIIESKKYTVPSGKEEKIDPQIDKDFTLDPDFLLEGYDKKKEYEKDWEPVKKTSHVCFKNHKHGNCDLGVLHYADPKVLNEMDYNIFKLNYPPNMTLQDYVNWLYCFTDDAYKLPYNHLKNLQKLQKNIPLVEKKGVLPPPGYNYAPLSAEKYFDQMYNINDEFNIASKLNSQTGPLMGYNADEYSEFNQNLNVKGTSSYLRNCDIAVKKTAKEVRDFVQPKDSNNIEEDILYDKYYVKKVEI